jgi:hypothetical protein
MRTIRPPKVFIFSREMRLIKKQKQGRMGAKGGKVESYTTNVTGGAS